MKFIFFMIFSVNFFICDKVIFEKIFDTTTSQDIIKKADNLAKKTNVSINFLIPENSIKIKNNSIYIYSYFLYELYSRSEKMIVKLIDDNGKNRHNKFKFYLEHSNEYDIFYIVNSKLFNAASSLKIKNGNLAVFSKNIIIVNPYSKQKIIVQKNISYDKIIEN